MTQQQTHDPQHGAQEEADDITPMMLTIGALLFASMVIAYFVAVG